jgi:hypothetical protein
MFEWYTPIIEAIKYWFDAIVFWFESVILSRMLYAFYSLFGLCCLLLYLEFLRLNLYYYLIHQDWSSDCIWWKLWVIKPQTVSCWGPLLKIKYHTFTSSNIFIIYSNETSKPTITAKALTIGYFSLCACIVFPPTSWILV